MFILYTLCYCMLFSAAMGGAVASLYQHDVQKSTGRVQSYLQSELAATSRVQHDILAFLHDRKIPIGVHKNDPRILSQSSAKVFVDSVDQVATPLDRVTVCDDSNPIECRISLGPAPFGSVCVAPCRCTGSQKWIQFSLYNKLRRKDPHQWLQCQSCMQKFDHSQFTHLGGWQSGLVSLFLDHVFLVRTTIFVTLLLSMSYIAVHQLALGLITSRILWQAYPQWSKVIHQIPLPLQLWIARYAVVCFQELYRAMETRFALSPLANLETHLLSNGLRETLLKVKADEAKQTASTFVRVMATELKGEREEE